MSGFVEREKTGCSMDDMSPLGTRIHDVADEEVLLRVAIRQERRAIYRHFTHPRARQREIRHFTHLASIVTSHTNYRHFAHRFFVTLHTPQIPKVIEKYGLI
jgi:hypothetical protein